MKFHGIHITETLNWNSHVQSLAKKLSKVLFMIKPLKGILSPCMIQNIYFTKFQALFRFKMPFWGGTGGKVSIRIFRIPKKVIRSMVAVSSRTACRRMLKEIKIPTLASLHVYLK